MFLDFYRLHQQPFGVTPDPAFLYPSWTHCEALDSLTQGILEGRGFLALIAEPGMGKTTLLYQVLKGLRERRVPCSCSRPSATPGNSFDTFSAS